MVKEEEEVKEVVKEKQLKYSIGEIVTGTAPVIMEDGKPLTDQQVLVVMLNKLEELSKKL